MRNLINISVISICLISILGACKKKDTAAPAVTPPVVTPQNPYYFKFDFRGASTTFNSNQPQYIFLYFDEAGGFQGNTALNLYPSVGLSFTWHSKDTVKENDLMALVGKTLYFSDTTITPEVTWDKDASGSDSWTSADTADTHYYVKVSDITFLKKDTAIGVAVKTYVITGTCNVLMANLSTTSILSGGDFHFIISRQDL